MWPDAKVPVCKVVSAGVHVLWLDNFSKFYAIAVQGLAGGACAECLWLDNFSKFYAVAV